MHSDALEQYSRSVYAFTMGLYTAAQVKDLRRNKGSKSYSCEYDGRWRVEGGVSGGEGDL
jgi:hypothetical protein